MKLLIDKKLFNNLRKMQKLDEVKKIVKNNGAELHNKTMMAMDAQYTAGYSTGNTKRRTILNLEDSGLTAKQTTDTEYIGYLEKGTRFMSARPAIKPAFDNQKVRFKADLRRLMK